MTRIFTPILLVLLVGCGGETADGPVTLTFVVWKPNNPAAWDQAIERFQERHPDIRIKRDVQPHSSTQFHDVLTQRLRNRDTSVDVFLMDVIWPPEFAMAGWALPLEGRFGEKDRKKFFAGTISAVTWRDRVYGVPLNTDSGLLYYRRDLLEKYGLGAPRTWEELVTHVDTITRGEKDPNLHGYSGQFKQYEGLVCNLLEYVHSNGGGLTEPDNAEAVEAVRFVRDRIIGAVAPRGVLTYEEQESLDLFKGGGAIFHRNWPYAWAILQGEKEHGSKVAGRVGIAKLPAFKRSVATLGGWSCGISAFSEHPNEAWTFISFLTGAETQKHFAIRAGKAPTRRTLYEDPDVLKANPQFVDLKSVFETATPRPRSPIYPRISNILQPFLHEAISKRDSDIPTLARNAAERIRREQEKLPTRDSE